MDGVVVVQDLIPVASEPKGRVAVMSAPPGETSGVRHYVASTASEICPLILPSSLSDKEE
jgi:hypothetical protein